MPDIPNDTETPTFLFADARHSMNGPSCRKCVQGYPLTCTRPGCGGHIHAALVRVDSASYLITLCERCLAPEPRELAAARADGAAPRGLITQ